MNYNQTKERKIVTAEKMRKVSTFLCASCSCRRWFSFCGFLSFNFHLMCARVFVCGCGRAFTGRRDFVGSRTGFSCDFLISCWPRDA